MIRVTKKITNFYLFPIKVVVLIRTYLSGWVFVLNGVAAGPVLDNVQSTEVTVNKSEELGNGDSMERSRSLS